MRTMDLEEDEHGTGMSVCDIIKARRCERKDDVNVGLTERLLSVALGGALAAYVAKRKPAGALAVGLASAGLLHRGFTGYCAINDLIKRDTAHDSSDRTRHALHEGRELEYAVTINRGTDELYHYWRKLENLPRFMRHVRSVTEIGAGRSHWEIDGPAGKSIEWDAEIVSDQPGELISWTSVGDPVVDNAGTVRFKTLPGGRGTEVRVTLRYHVPGGAAGAAISAILGASPSLELRQDLERFKAMMECGNPDH